MPHFSDASQHESVKFPKTHTHLNMEVPCCRQKWPLPISLHRILTRISLKVHVNHRYLRRIQTSIERNWSDVQCCGMAIKWHNEMLCLFFISTHFHLFVWECIFSRGQRFRMELSMWDELSEKEIVHGIHLVLFVCL